MPVAMLGGVPMMVGLDIGGMDDMPGGGPIMVPLYGGHAWRRTSDRAECKAGHPVKADFRPRHCCDLCGRIGTEYRCTSGCDFDMCASCYNQFPESAQGSASSRQDRDTRLNGNVKTLYHQTDEDGSRGVLKTGFQRGKPTCIAGSGIYFAESAEDTDHKAHNKGIMLTVRVRLGRVKRIHPDGDRSITFSSLQSEGYDSVEIPRAGGTEYVVYNRDQAEVIDRKPM